MLLFTPGPTPVGESTRVAMSTPTIHHRTPEFEEIFAKTRELLKKLFGYDEVLMLSSSGTGAMEAAVVNFCKKKAMTVSAGKFGERFGKIVQAYGKELVELKYEWSTPANVDDVKIALEQNPDVEIFCIQISESAGGLRHPVEKIASYIKSVNPDIIVIADGITAVGVEKIDNTNIDVLISGSQKALMLPPGLALLGLSQKAVLLLEQSGGAGFYLNLFTELKSQRKNTTAWTAATTLIIGLRSILEEIDSKGGFDKLYEQTSKRAKATEAALRAIGLEIYPKSPAFSMSTVIDEDAEKIRKLLKNEFEVNVAGGQDHLKGKIFRINQMGLIPPHEMTWVVNAIELSLAKLGTRAYDGSANKTFCESYFQ
jgi:aspartate aminotransferase-like enzyme